MVDDSVVSSVSERALDSGDGGGGRRGFVSRLLDMRDSAVEYRNSLGVDADWIVAQSNYDGNFRGLRGGLVDKERSAVHGGSGSLVGEGEGDRLFLGLTRMYADNAFTRICDLLLPGGNRPWTLVPSEVPGVGSSGGPDGSVSPNIEEGLRREVSEMGLAQGTSEHEEEVSVRMEAVRQAVSADAEAARDSARKAELQIAEWHERSGFLVEVMKVIEHAVKLGTGVLCGPKRRKYRRAVYRDGGLRRFDGVIPESTAVMPWNCYPDPECGVDVQEGSHHWERSWLQRRDLQQLVGDPNYDSEQVRLILREGPLSSEDRVSRDSRLGGGPADLPKSDDWSRFEIWYGYADVSVEDLAASATGSPFDASGFGSGEVVGVEVQIVNDRLIRIEPSLSVYGGDRFPYSYFRYSSMSDADGRPVPWGRGVPSLTEVAQRAFNAAYNRLIQNMGITSFPMFEYDSKHVRPENGEPRIEAGKIWRVEAPAGQMAGASGRTSIRPIVVESQAQNLILWMQFNLQMFEDLTGLSGVVGSAAGRNAPDTVGGMQLAANQTDSVIRRVVRSFDEEVMAPHIRRYYEYLLLDEFVEPSMKGDFSVKISGTSVLERSVKLDMYRNLMNSAVNPAYGIDPLKLVREMLDQAGLDADRVKYTDEQIRAMEEAARGEAERGSDAERVAQIKAQSDFALAKVRADVEMEKERTKLRIEENREHRDLKGKASDEWKVQVGAATEEAKLASKSEEAEKDRRVKLASAAMEVRSREAIEARRARSDLERAAAEAGE